MEVLQFISGCYVMVLVYCSMEDSVLSTILCHRRIRMPQRVNLIICGIWAGGRKVRWETNGSVDDDEMQT